MGVGVGLGREEVQRESVVVETKGWEMKDVAESIRIYGVFLPGAVVSLLSTIST